MLIMITSSSTKTRNIYNKCLQNLGDIYYGMFSDMRLYSLNKRKYLASISLGKPGICAQRVTPQLLIAAQHLIWLYRPTWEWQSQLQQMHVKMLFPMLPCCILSIMLLLGGKPSFLLSILQCKSCLEPEQSLATSSYLSMSMFITLMSLLQVCLKRR